MDDILHTKLLNMRYNFRQVGIILRNISVEFLLGNIPM